ncbi:MAG: alpha/beta hydrolase [Oscillospiraceae bacterium]|nr:alpha/beta hydrolase [Oscillospiraceae bacterium]
MKKRIIIAAGIALLAIAAFLLRPYYLNITFGISDFFRDRGLKTPEDIVRIDDQAYGSDPMQVFDVYYPVGTDHPLPTIVSIHGGGYTYGSKEVYQYYCMNLAERGFTVVNFSYRLAPKSKFPAQLEDTNRLMACICVRAEDYYVDPDNIFFVGDSAGAHLNAQYSAAVTNPAYADLLDLSIPAFTLRATALNCGVYELKDFSSSQMKYFLADGMEEEMDIVGHITSDFPPAFVMSATGDGCLPYAEPMYELLTARGVNSELHIYGDEQEKPPHVFHVNIKSEVATVCNDEECAFFRERIE